MYKGNNKGVADRIGKSKQVWKFLRLVHRLDEAGINRFHIFLSNLQANECYIL